MSSGLPLLADDEQRKQNRRGQYRELQQIEVGELGKGSGSKRWGWEGRKLLTADHYDGTVDAGADVFALTVGAVAFEAAIPPFLRIVTENYESADEVSIGRCVFAPVGQLEVDARELLQCLVEKK